jgi:hypothetical protein
MSGGTSDASLACSTAKGVSACSDVIYKQLSILTGLKAGSLALVAGVACSSVLEAGWG